MKKALMTLVISIALVLIIPFSARADILDLLIDPATLHIGTWVETLNIDGNIQNVPVISAGLMPNKTGYYRDTANISGPIQTAMISEDTNALAGLSVFTNARSRASANLGPKDLTAIICSHDGLPSGTFIAADSIGAGEAGTYSASFTNLGMVKKVLEPGTMLLLGSCLLGLGLFAIKFRR